MRVLLLAGGWSNEREVSLSGAARIEQALVSLGHSPTLFDPAARLDELIGEARRHDFAFINLHGSPGEDGLIQALLERAGCPYQGAGPAASMLALDKASSKQVFAFEGIPTPAWTFLSGMPGANWDPPTGYPVFVKPNNGGSSLDMTRVEERGQLRPALERVFASHDTALVEQAIAGDELTCAVLGDEALPTILIRPVLSKVFFDFESKYEKGGAEELCPAPVDDEINARVRAAALQAHLALGIDGYSRADFIVADSTPWLLEVNTLPGMTGTSLVPQAAAAAGMDFDQLVARLIELGLAGHGPGRPCDQSE